MISASQRWLETQDQNASQTETETHVLGANQRNHETHIASASHIGIENQRFDASHEESETHKRGASHWQSETHRKCASHRKDETQNPVARLDMIFMSFKHILYKDEAERNVERREARKMGFEPTIAVIVPVHEKFIELKPCLTSLVRNSAERHEVILAGDRTNWKARGGPFKTLREWLQRKKDIGWLDKWGFKWLECPDCEELNTPRPEWHGQCGIGEYRAVNYAIQNMESEYYMVFDDDMWACKGWDTNLLKHLHYEDRFKYVYMPVHCHVSHRAPWPYTRENVWWTDTILPIHANMGVINEDTRQIDHFKESALYEYYEKTKRNGETLIEPCGLRRYVHWWPHVVHRDLWAEAGGFKRDANPWAAADCDYDSRLGTAGARKFLVMDSYIFHIKNNILLDISEDIGFDEL